MSYVFRTFCSGSAKSKIMSSINDLNSLQKRYEDFVGTLGKEYPGYNDPGYMSWLNSVRNAPSDVNKVNEVSYSQDNKDTWKIIYERLRPLHYEYACSEHIDNLQELEKLKILSSDEIPNFIKINKFLQEKSGFRMVNVGGMIDPRSFLCGLSFGVFYGTQFIRHKSVPFYSPEPDIVHEVMGHVPMLANQKFAQFSKKIGKLAREADDQMMDILCKIYFYSIEFGVTERKIFGAGILGSCEEMELVGKGKGCIKEWDFEKVTQKNLTLSNYQPEYFNIHDIKYLDQIIIDLELKFIKIE